MAWGSLGTAGTTTNKTANSSFTCAVTRTCSVGEVLLVLVAKDNAATTDGNTSEVTSVTAGTNTFTKLREFCNSRGAAAGGATISVWASVLTQQITNGSNVTINLSGTTTAKAVSMWSYSVSSGAILSVAAAGTDRAMVGSNIVTNTSIAGLTSAEYLFLVAGANEDNTVGFTPGGTGYTTITSVATSGGSATTNIVVGGGFRILTGTGDNQNSTTWASGADNADIYIAVKEAGGVSGTATITEASDTSTATGTLSIQGTASVTEAGDTLTATGALTIQATATITEASDTVVATGTTVLTTTGTATITEDSDTSVATGTLKVQGTATVTEASDTGTATGTLPVQAVANITEASDTTTATGTLKIAGVAAITEAGDTSAATGTVRIAGVATINEASDTVASTALAPVQGVANLTEASDLGTASATLVLSGLLSGNEDSDSVVASATVAIAGVADVSEDSDTVASSGVIVIQALADINEDSDTLDATGTVLTSGVQLTGDIHEADDVAVATAKVPIHGSANIYEDGYPASVLVALGAAANMPRVAQRMLEGIRMTALGLSPLGIRPPSPLDVEVPLQAIPRESARREP